MFIIVCVVVVVTIISAVWALSLWRCQDTKDNFRSTFSLPLVGYLPFLTAHPHRKFMQLAGTLGPVFWTQLGRRRVLVLNDYASISTMYRKEESLGRPRDISFNVLINLEGLGTLSGPEWREQKRFTMTQLRNLGFGRPALTQSEILRNAARVCSKIDSRSGRVSIRELYDVDDFIVTRILGLPRGSQPEVKACIRNAIRSLGQVSLLMFFPRLAQWLAASQLIGPLKQLKRNFELVNQYVKSSIAEHERRLIASGDKSATNNADRKTMPIGDYIDSFLAQILEPNTGPRKESVANDHSTEPEVEVRTTFTRNMLAGNVQGFLAAGIETVLTTIEWAVLILAARPDVQARAREEIDARIGKDLAKVLSKSHTNDGAADEDDDWNGNDSRMLDRKQLPYCWAMLMEIERWKTISPIGLARETTADCQLWGVPVPAGTLLLANLYAIHHDPNTWSDPHLFQPERFLEPESSSNDTEPAIKWRAAATPTPTDGCQTTTPTRCWMPFSIGKRSCPGESVAQMEVLLHLVALLWKYTIHLPPPHSRSSPTSTTGLFEETLGLTLMPRRATQLRFRPRPPIHVQRP